MGEGKEGKSSGDAPDIDPLLADFAEFATSSAFSDEVTAFMRSNCAPFASDNFDDGRSNISEGEQKLEWTATHREYLEVVESKLEEFCAEKGTSPEDVFAKIEEASQSSLAEFLPQFITNTDYVYFATQMNALADEAQSKDDALAAAQDDNELGFNLSGVWVPQENVDVDKVKKFVKFNNVPWMFRRLFVMAQRQVKQVVIQHTEAQMQFKYRIKFFGNRVQRIPLNNITTTRKNLWRVKVSVRGWNDTDTDPPHVRMRSSGQSYFPEGSFSEHSFHIENGSSDGRPEDDVLVWTRHIHRTDLGDMSIELKFHRADLRSSKESKK